MNKIFYTQVNIIMYILIFADQMKKKILLTIYCLIKKKFVLLIEKKMYWVFNFIQKKVETLD